ncbi:MAG: sigma-70 family RNA polymerase sigma factor [Brevundimonas sp.]|jgi:RNA polymerase sigma-70 factor (ECF subfamily)|uniref:sigma-70 family RNA polymerase sigma factor n=1 Tax=Brevundimonas sp. TaxID=1871086 RepID=UPI0025C60A08|nr:sigma-70 family RNA polymerase sigma factor [Brevundimonas sp.]MBX3476915.1 sigma-70 family RNA polymerase sigma factor [Brevundimonas sp.]
MSVRSGPRPPSADDEAFKRELVTLIPHLRAFARTLTGDPTAADDLAQDAMMKAWDARASYQMGTNMKAWTFMILRNQFYSEKRRSWRQSQLDQEAAERTLVAVDDPEAPVALDELRQALKTLPEEQREALILVGAGGFAYEEAAEICDCAVGTVKSRVSRARKALQATLERGGYDRDGQAAGDAMRSILGEADRLSGNRQG